MLCRRSADRAAPAGSLFGRPVDTLHTGGTEGPETHTHTKIINTNSIVKHMGKLNTDTTPYVLVAVHVKIALNNQVKGKCHL